MANKQLQLRRGTATATDSFVGAEGEITYVTDTKTVRVHDGVAGGVELLKSDMSNVSAGGTTITVDAKLQVSDSAYATVDGDDDLTLATKGWVADQGSGGGLVSSQDNIGDTSITSATLGDFLVYQGASASSSAKWVNKTISGDVNVDENGASVIQDDAVVTSMILDANVTNAKLANSSVVVTDGTTAHTLSLGNTLTFSNVANETTVTQSGGNVVIGIVDSPSLGNVTASTLSVTNNLTVNGDLTVSGSTTTVNTETINLADNIITLNSNATGSASENAGLEVERGDDTNVAIRWDEVTSHKWQVTEDGTNYYALVNVGDSGTVSNTMIADGAVDGNKIADQVIDSDHYVVGSIDDEHIADDTITSSKLSDFADSLTQTSGHIVASNGSVLTSLETDGDVEVSVTGATLTFGIASGVIVDADISSSASIAGSKIASNSITTAQLANSGNTDTIQTSNIADSAIAAAKIANQAITAAKIHADVAGVGIAGANGSALSLDLSELSAATISVANDSFAIIDASASNGSRQESIADLVDAISGDEMTSTQGVLEVTALANVTAGTVSSGKAVIVNNSNNISGFNELSATSLVGALTGNVTGDVTGDVTGTVSSIANHDTDDLSEGTTNQYYTDTRSRAAISVTDNGGDGALAYNSTSGVISYTGPSASEVRAHFSAGTGVDITNGTLSIGQVVGTTSDVSFNSVTATTLTGAFVGNVTGNITGDVTGTVSSIANHDTDGLSEGATNQYYTDGRARASVSVTDNGGDGSLSYNSTSGVISYTGPSASEVRAHFVGGTGVSITNGTLSIGQAVSTSSDVSFNTVTADTLSGAFVGNVTGNLTGNVTGDLTGDVTGTVSSIANHDTDSLSEGATNQYYTDTRARASVSVADNGGDGSLSYNSTTGVISYAGPSASEVRAHFAAGTGVEITGGTLSIGQAVGTTDAVTFSAVSAPLTGNVTGNVTGNLTGNVTGDVAGDLTGNVTASTVSSVVGSFSGAVSADSFTDGVATMTGGTLTGLGKLDTASLFINSTEVEATAAEINYLASASASGGGTDNSTAGKAALTATHGSVVGVRAPAIIANTSLKTYGNFEMVSDGSFEIRSSSETIAFKVDVTNSQSFIKAEKLAIDDSLIELNLGNTSSHSGDLGFYARKTESVGGTPANNRITGLVLDRSADEWKLFRNAPFLTNNSNLVDFSDSNVVYDDLRVGSLASTGDLSTTGVVRSHATASSNATTLSEANHIWFQDGDTYADVTLPAAADHAGREFIIKNTGSVTNVDIAVQTGESIDGQTNGTASAYASSAAVRVISDGSAWWTI